MISGTEQPHAPAGTPRRSGITRNVVVAIAMWFAVVAIWEWLTPPHGSSITLCLFKRCTGIPCPTCGSTRAVKSIFQGEVVQAFLFNPLLVILAAMLIIWLVIRLALGRERLAAFAARHHRAIPAALILGLMLNWVYLLIRHWNGSM